MADVELTEKSISSARQKWRSQRNVLVAARQAAGSGLINGLNSSDGMGTAAVALRALKSATYFEEEVVLADGQRHPGSIFLTFKWRSVATPNSAFTTASGTLAASTGACAAAHSAFATTTSALAASTGAVVSATGALAATARNVTTTAASAIAPAAPTLAASATSSVSALAASALSASNLAATTRDSKDAATDQGTLVVRLVRGSGLRPCTAGTSDPYVKLTIGQERHQSHVIMKTLEPHWGETFEFSGTRKEIASQSLALQVWDYKSFHDAFHSGRSDGDSRNSRNSGRRISSISRVSHFGAGDTFHPRNGFKNLFKWKDTALPYVAKSAELWVPLTVYMGMLLVCSLSGEVKADQLLDDLEFLVAIIWNL